jgi:hypothetical protein
MVPKNILNNGNKRSLCTRSTRGYFSFCISLLLTLLNQVGLSSKIFADIGSTNVNGIASIAGAIGDVSIRLGFVMVLIYMTMMASQKISDLGGSWAGAISSRSNRLLGRGVFGGGGALLRNTVGWAGARTAQSTAVRQLANSGWVGRSGRYWPPPRRQSACKK